MQTTKTKAQAASATAELSEEHQNILAVIAALRVQCDRVLAGAAPDQGFFGKAVDFIKSYADRLHHAKEEDILFPSLDEPQVAMHCDPRPVMLHEHEGGRGYVRDMEAALDGGDPYRLVEAARGYCGLLEEHIYKEDNILFPMAEQALGPARSAEVKRRFGAVNKKHAELVAEKLAFVAE